MNNIVKRCTRFINFIVDFLCFIFITTIIFFVIGRYIDASIIENGYSNRLLSILIYLTYYTVFESVFSTTPGKLVTKTKVVEKNTNSISFSTAVIRSVSRIIPFEPISIFFSANKLSWHDKFSNTKVIKVKS